MRILGYEQNAANWRSSMINSAFLGYLSFLSIYLYVTTSSHGAWGLDLDRGVVRYKNKVRIGI